MGFSVISSARQLLARDPEETLAIGDKCDIKLVNSLAGKDKEFANQMRIRAQSEIDAE